MKDYLIKRPMLFASLIACIICIVGSISAMFLITAGVLIIILISFLLISRGKKNLIFPLFMLFLLIISNLNYNEKTEKADALSGRTVNGEFIVVDTPKIYDRYCSATFEVKKCEEIPSGYKIFAFYNYESIHCGDRIRARIKLKSLSGSEYRLSNYSEGILLDGSIESITILKGKEDGVIKCINDIKGYITDTLFSNLGYHEASTLSALIYGDKTYVTEEFDSCVKRAGVSHVMVVSGMHLAIIVSLFVLITQKYVYNRYLKALIIFLTVVFMTALCGFSKSVLRAGITYILFALSIVFKRENCPENTLGAAVLIILISNPFALFSIAFQLSVLSTFGILVIALPVIKRVKELKIINNRIFYYLLSSVIISLSALLMTLPVTVYVFGYVSVVSVISNLLISQAVTLALSMSICGLIINLAFPFIAKPFFLFSGIVTKYINNVIEWLGSFKNSVAYLGKDTALLVTIMILSVLVLLLACKKRYDMLKLENIRTKVIREGGGKLKWQ